MDIDKIRTFCKLIENKTLVEVAKSTKMSVSGVQRQITSLEKELGLKLFRKENKLLKPTEDGLKFYHYSQKIIEEYDRALTEMSHKSGELKGRFTINAFPAVVSSWLILDLAKYINSNTDVIFSLLGDDHPVDEINEQWDVSIRADEEVDEAYEKKYLRTFRFNLYASQAYIQKYGLPKEPEDLINHRLIVYGLESKNNLPNLNWHLKYVPKDYKRIVYMNSGHAIVNAIDNSLGLGIVSGLGAKLGKKEFVRVLPQLKSYDVDFYLIYKKDTPKIDHINRLYDYLIRKYANVSD